MKKTALFIGGIILKALLLAGIELGLLFLVAKLFPLPKGQGLQYAAHGFWALLFSLISVVGYIIAASIRPAHQWLWFVIALGFSLGMHLLLFLSA